MQVRGETKCPVNRLDAESDFIPVVGRQLKYHTRLTFKKIQENKAGSKLGTFFISKSGEMSESGIRDGTNSLMPFPAL